VRRFDYQAWTCLRHQAGSTKTWIGRVDYVEPGHDNFRSST
jgi:hypothetical protein